MAEKILKIALVITRMDRGGAPDMAAGLFNYLESEGHNSVTLITGPTISPAKDVEEFMQAHKEHILIIPELKRKPFLPGDVVALVKLFFILSKGKFDVVHTHTAKAGFIGRITAKLAGVRAVVHTPHGHNFYGYFSPIVSGLVVFLEKIAAIFADKITVFTDIEKKDMLVRKICNPQKIVVVHSGVDLSKYNNTFIDMESKKKELGIGTASLVVGMISRLDAVKGPEYFIDSIKYIVPDLPRVKFLIIGDGPLKEKMMSRCKELEIDDRVVFTGWREDINEILPILDVVVLASLNEAVGRVILEAGVLAKPVVATDVGGIPEIVKRNLTGILVPPADARQIAEAVLILLRDEEKRLKMGHAAREWVKRNFDEKKMFGEIQNLYKDLIKT